MGMQAFESAICATLFIQFLLNIITLRVVQVYFAVDVELFHKSTNCLIKVKIAKLISVSEQQLKAKQNYLTKFKINRKPKELHDT